jgi:alkyldihydroxyacetonephosphate synthase
MRRWNGWGDNTVEYPLPKKGPKLLLAMAGAGTPQQDAKLETVVESVPNSRLASHPLVSDDPLERLCHARGQSLPDWIALRSGRINAFPDGVAHPMNEDEIVELIRYAGRVGAQLIPYGGGTSVVGHINPTAGDRPVLTVNLRRLNQLERFDDKSQVATFGAGVSGPELEAQLRALDFTLGHFPQSFELSTLGGWIATHSTGQQSLGYGRIEDLFRGGRIISPAGVLELLPHPASAAGPDLRQLVLGSEGRMGIITKATVRTSPLPEKEEFHAVFFPNFAQGQTAVRQMVQARLPLSMLRLSTAVETTTTLALAGHEKVIGLLEQGLSLRRIGDEKSMLLLGFTGSESVVKSSRKIALSIARRHKGVAVGQQFGKQWHKGRFRTPYLRNTLWEQGYALDTLETAVVWDNVDSTLKAIETALKTALDETETGVHVFTHLSQFYPEGASIYTTYMYGLAQDPDETLQKWHTLKSAASQAIVKNKGTISHQHGVGLDHARYLEKEKGELGIKVIADMMHRFDPHGIMNPGKLLA